MKKADITPELVAGLVARQFPPWADLPISRVELDGWDNTTFRLGTTMSVRLPSADMYVAQIDKEHRWLPVLRDHLPLPIPEPLAKGVPGLGFPRPWSVYGWIDGEIATDESVDDLEQFARDLAAFLSALNRCDVTDGPEAGPHSHMPRLSRRGLGQHDAWLARASRRGDRHGRRHRGVGGGSRFPMGAPAGVGPR